MARDPHTGAPSALRELPANVEMEQSILGSLLLRNDVYDVLAPIIDTSDFMEEIHRRIYDVAKSLIGAGHPATGHTLQTYLGNPEIGPGVTMSEYIARICAESALPIMAKDYARGLRELAERRSIIEIATELREQAYDLPPSVKPATIAGDAIARLDPVMATAMQATRLDPLTEAGAIIGRLREVQEGKRKARLVSTGFDDLDRATNGYVPSALWVLGARPAIGKTTFFVASANRAARRGAGVLGFALEVGREQIMARVMSDLSHSGRDGVDFKSIMGEVVDHKGILSLERVAERLGGMPLVIDVPSRLTPAEIRVRIRTEKARMAARGHGLDVVFIDYLKQVQASDRYKGNRVYEVGEISYSLKQIAKDEGVCIVLLVQLNRALESRENKRPMLSDLRESGDLEADADVVAFLHRESVHIENSPDYIAKKDAAVAAFVETSNKAEIILAKNRAGPTTTVHLWCDMAFSTMADQARNMCARTPRARVRGPRRLSIHAARRAAPA